MNLYIDDVREAPEGWAIARTYDDAIRLLSRWQYEIVSLDHDLGESMTGYDILRTMDEGVVHCPQEIWLHTYNPVGRARMAQVLRRMLGEGRVRCRPKDLP